MSAKPPGKVWLGWTSEDEMQGVPNTQSINGPVEEWGRVRQFEYVLASDAAAELEAARAVIAELVACKGLKEHLDAMRRADNFSFRSIDRAADEYSRRKPLAWTAARAWLGNVPDA